jgi:hypothetical protein
VTRSLEDAKRLVTGHLQNREEPFLRLLEQGIYANPRSPYRRLLLHAGFEFEDVRGLVREAGLELALLRLHAAGVYVTLDEFKGRSPVRRPGLEFAVSDSDFDNPLLTVHFESRTSGSRGPGTRVPIDFDSYAYEAADYMCDLYATGLQDRQLFMWRPEPPSPMGLRTVLLFMDAGMTPARWYSPIRVAWNRQGIQGRALLLYTLVISRLAGRPIPRPRYLADESQMVELLAEAVRDGKPALVCCEPSRWVRTCAAANQQGIDIGGTAFWGGGEPYTSGKAAVLEQAGAVAAPNYGSHEAGNIGLTCGNPAEPDDLHFLSDRLAVLQLPTELAMGATVDALFYTTVTASAPKIMLNAESGDYGVLEERNCGCLWQELGFKTHIHHVRSYEKLTSEGVMFMGSMLHELLEETLPARFGGAPTDYQLVEEEEDGLPRVSIVVAPGVGEVDEGAVVNAVIESVGFADWSRRMADTWLHAGTLRVVRREPYASAAGKILPLHVLGAARAGVEQTARGP